MSPQVGPPSPKVITINLEIQKRHSFFCDLGDINPFAGVSDVSEIVCILSCYFAIWWAAVYIS